MAMLLIPIQKTRYFVPNYINFILICSFLIYQFKWRLLKKASQVFYLHFALKKRAFVEEIHEKQEQVCRILIGFEY